MADQIRSDPRGYVRSSRKVQERRLVLGYGRTEYCMVSNSLKTYGYGMLYSTVLHCIVVYYITLHYIILHYVTFNTLQILILCAVITLLYITQHNGLSHLISSYIISSSVCFVPSVSTSGGISPPSAWLREGLDRGYRHTQHM
jgi:hypothetical protein